MDDQLPFTCLGDSRDTKCGGTFQLAVDNRTAVRHANLTRETHSRDPPLLLSPRTFFHGDDLSNMSLSPAWPTSLVAECSLWRPASLRQVEADLRTYPASNYMMSCGSVVMVWRTTDGTQPGTLRHESV